jgi:hypothetical protein
MAQNIFPESPSGIPSGNTASRPASPGVGDTYYNGELGILEIYTDTGWFPCSSVPAVPTGVTATNVGTGRAYDNGAISVAFTAGTGGGIATSYTAISGSTIATGSSSPIVLTGFAPGATPTAYIIANNSYGNSAASNTSTTTVTTVPDVPTSPSATSGAQSAAVTWTAPAANGGSAITGYTVNAYSGATLIGSQTTSDTSMTYTGLTDDVAYTFKVRATNANGTGLESVATSSVTPSSVISVRYLVVAGGGSGGGQMAGGAGAGGFRTSTSSFNLSTNFTVTIGAGGGTSDNYGSGKKGSNSTFATITSTGGGFGGHTNSPGGPGGSGGGGGGSYYGGGGAGGAGNEGSYSPAEGYSGGAGHPTNRGGGAGGGASVSGASSTGGAMNGAAGLSSDITGSTVFYAGGGGSGDGGGGGGTGGLGGGGNGGSGNKNATANTGGGGGGYNDVNSGASVFYGGLGGSGIVILRYPEAKSITIGAGLTGTTAAPSGGFKVTTITSGTGNVSWS